MEVLEFQMSKPNLFYRLTLLLLSGVVICGCVYETMKENKNLDDCPKWIEVVMYIYSGIIILLSLIVGGTLDEEAEGMSGCGCLVTWFVGLLVGYGFYWLLLGINSWFKWLVNKF